MSDPHGTSSLCARAGMAAGRIRPSAYGGGPAAEGKRGDMWGNVVPNTGGWR